MVKYFILSLLLFSVTNDSYAFNNKKDKAFLVRALKVSSTGKVILINKGIEDGLVAGKYGSFYYRDKLMAKGSVERASPVRTVWSIYVNTDPNFFKEVVEKELVLELRPSSAPIVTREASEVANDKVTEDRSIEAINSEVSTGNNPSNIFSTYRKFYETPWEANPAFIPNPAEKQWGN